MNSQGPGGNGGSGVVVLRYQMGQLATKKATGGLVSFYGSKTIHTFTKTWNFCTNLIGLITNLVEPMLLVAAVVEVKWW